VTERAGIVGVAMAALLVLCLSACQATIRVGIDVGPDGSGTVSVTATLDREAVAALPNLAAVLPTADLQQAGWQIQGPTPTAGGGATLVATKSFATPGQAVSVIGELSGPSGPFHDLKVGRVVSPVGTTTQVSGTVDLTCGLACFSDAQLTQTLGAGLDPAKLQEAGIDPSQIVTFEVDVHLPGVVQSTNAPVQTNGVSEWQIKLGAKASLAMSARIVHHSRRLLLKVVIAAGVVLVVAAAVIWLLGRRRRRRRARGRGGRSRPLHAAARR